MEAIVETLEHNSKLPNASFDMNYMKCNTAICHLLTRSLPKGFQKQALLCI